MGQDWSTSPAGSLGQAWIQSQPCSVLRLAGTTFDSFRYNARSSSRSRCRALQLYSAPERSTPLYSSTALYTLHPLHPPAASVTNKQTAAWWWQLYYPS